MDNAYVNYLMHHGIKGQRWHVRRFQNPDGTRTAAGKARERKAYDSGFKDGKEASSKNKNSSSSATSKTDTKDVNTRTLMDQYKKTGKSVKDMTDAELTKANVRYKLENQYKQNVKSENPDKALNKIRSGQTIVNETSKLVDRAKQIERESRPKPHKEKLDLSQMTDQQLRDKINRARLENDYANLYAKDVEPQVSKGRRFVQNTLEIGGSVLTATGSALAIALAIKQLRD